MTYTIYVIRSQTSEYTYTGMTNDLNRRLMEHNSGKTKSNKYYAPFVLIYSEEVSNSKEARIREKFLKGGIGRNRLKDNGYK